MRPYEIRMQGQVADLSIIGDIDWWNNNSADFARQLNELRAAGVTELRGYINSGGGHMWEANEIYNLLIDFPGRKTCRLGALVASAATTIACAFTDGIEMAANGQYMIHNPNVSVQGGDKEIRAGLQLYQNVRQGAINIYVKRTGLLADEISAMMEATTWMDAPTAKAKGFITAVSGEVAELPSDTVAVLNKYHYAGVPSVLNQVLSGAAPRPASTATPANRAGWKLADWQANDSEGLVAMIEAGTPLFRTLYQQHYGFAWNGLNNVAANRESRNTQSDRAPANATAPAPSEAGAESPRRSLLEQLPQLGPQLTLALTTTGAAIDEATGPASASRVPQRMLYRETGVMELLLSAGGMVAGTEAAVYLLGALGVLEAVAEDAANPVRRAVAREQGIESTDWSAYANRWRDVAGLVQKAEVAAGQPTAANYAPAAAPKGRENWTLQDWMEKDAEGLQALRKDNPALFQQLYHKRFGITPEL